MVRDRLQELHEKMGKKKEEETSEATVILMNERENEIENLQKTVESIDRNIEQMLSSTEEMKKIHFQLLTNPSIDQKVKKALDDLNVQFKILSKKTKEALNNLQLDCIQQERNQDTNNATYRIRNMQFNVLQKKLMETVNAYNIEQLDYKDKCKEQFKRQLEITGKFTTNEELEELLENPNPGIFIQDIINETRVAKQQLMEIEARHADIIKIEKSIRELHEMFVDMANLVTNQGEMINRIENQVRGTQDYVEKANQETKQAMIYQKKARKLKIIIFIILAILLLIILYSIFY